MQTNRRRQMPRTMAAQLSAVAMMLMLMAGCTTPQGNNKGVPDAQGPPAAHGPNIVRAPEGQEGFIIKEFPRMTAASLRAFEQAVESINRREFDRAIELLEPIVAQSPGVTAPYINLAMAYEALGEKEKSKEHLRTALLLVPNHPVACNMYGLLCRKSGDFSEAREYYQRAAADFPEYYPVHRNIGILCDLYLNDPACALKHYEIYSAAKPEDQQVKLWIVDLRKRLPEGQKESVD